ncbi:hypothetical protein [Thermoflavimicrobium dichotomicum]|uniref:Serine/threonine protein kinase n=1 Tax=Thermoflavimicrobium dichotomicum TaxID=46223 RepID=A0A1I3MJ25_9BACL|nr:hypothetical protein [Thermoflavimicrobium dichotomicum]SFI96676.1 hypothetical protein SAMN05421852_10379 [Thermoflavimicrobium dichotomicum]
MDHQFIESLIEQVEFQVYPDNRVVTVHQIPEELQLVGKGTDAVVVRHLAYPRFAFKVYARERLDKLENEYKVYQQLGDSPYFCVCYSKGSRFLVLSYEQGPTLYECLEQGIVIPEQVIIDVEQARAYVRKVGLNPRDIHLKNIIMQNGRAKLIDVSEYIREGNDGRWEHLLQAYELFYPLIRGKRIPHWIIELVKRLYYKQVHQQFSLMEFGRWFLHLFRNVKQDEDHVGKGEK